ncbi:hypothetical protein ACH4SK_26860 [Streptomyces inhibens]|uniref:hypothetical protein n=1 Tax=Streptomyces inhibens TaxID=2293571 RepID=UPI00379C7581
MTTPIVVLLLGITGSGTTTLARALAEHGMVDDGRLTRPCPPVARPPAAPARCTAAVPSGADRPALPASLPRRSVPRERGPGGRRRPRQPRQLLIGEPGQHRREDLFLRPQQSDPVHQEQSRRPWYRPVEPH